MGKREANSEAERSRTEAFSLKVPAQAVTSASEDTVTAESSPESDIIEIKRVENLAPTHQGPEYDENAVREDEPSEINGRVEPLPTPKKKLEKKEKNILEAWRKAEIQNRIRKAFLQCNICEGTFAAWYCHGCKFNYCHKCQDEIHSQYAAMYETRLHSVERIDSSAMMCTSCGKDAWKMSKTGLTSYWKTTSAGSKQNLAAL